MRTILANIHYFKKAAALQAISATNQLFNCGSGTDFTSIQCAINSGAQMTNYANNGLTSSADFGGVCLFPSPTGPGNYTRAFPGINPNAPPLPFRKSIGRSVGGLNSETSSQACRSRFGRKTESAFHRVRS